jgi:Domain of unknown function (DUF4249)
MKKIITIITTLFAITSCTKEVVIDLNSTAPQIVIEGVITDQIGIYEVKITKTVNFSDSNNYPAVQGAIVTISDNKGNSEKLTEAKAGIYQTKKLVGISGNTYTLTVVTNGKTYTAKSTMPQNVKLNSVEIAESTISNGGIITDKIYDVLPHYFDPTNVANYYYFNMYANGIKDKGFFNVSNDILFNGQQNAQPIFYGQDFKLKTNDKLIVEMLCIDKGVFEYFNSLSQSINGGSATPTNPVSNILGGALGYFSAHTVQKVTVVVP